MQRFALLLALKLLWDGKGCTSSTTVVPGTDQSALVAYCPVEFKPQMHWSLFCTGVSFGGNTISPSPTISPVNIQNLDVNLLAEKFPFEIAPEIQKAKRASCSTSACSRYQRDVKNIMLNRDCNHHHNSTTGLPGRQTMLFGSKPVEKLPVLILRQGQSIPEQRDSVREEQNKERNPV